MTLSFERLEQMRHQQEKQRAVPMERALGGEEVRCGSGVFHRRHQCLDGHLSHGPFPLKRSQLRPLSHWLPEVDGTRMLYLDTETTGLAGGSGTYAFMIGLAFFEQGQLRLEQLIMRSHCEEKAMLQYLIERLENSDGLITFNGKSFDIPLLQTRLIMNRLRYDLEELPHLDLLPVSRRLWSQALENCRLETLETEILGLPRQGDVPGWMVPQIFFRYLQTGCARGLAQVAEHNRRDILTMVGLVAGLWGYVDEPHDWSQRFRQDARLLHLEDLALAQQLFRQRRFAESRTLLERCYAHFEDGPLRQCGTLLARLRRRNGEVAAAQEIWQRLAEIFPHDPELLEQVAKQEEHVQRDWACALDWVERALRIKPLAPTRARRLHYRRERLQRRMLG
ncbi:MAG: ribonuclease H-like domain-containing protein [Candidatus Eremiobacteraeota bacterium]|nr:ribonuclease H-like domain-containing protein [Candidatus Eremiobacteraeota bacterium]MCW5867501.1 ribonuclease H-like domain-containing protein [Candidatus Eremiobacteraeota bacterium]